MREVILYGIVNKGETSHDNKYCQGLSWLPQSHSMRFAQTTKVIVMGDTRLLQAVRLSKVDWYELVEDILEKLLFYQAFS